jgi:3-dehydroquinate dehydratase
MASLIYVLNGPNMNLLGKREPEKYGHATLDDVEVLCRETGKKHGFEIEFRQSNKEGELIDFIHEAAKKKRCRHRHQSRRLYHHLDRHHGCDSVDQCSHG